jgi:hypothetical protein
MRTILSVAVILTALILPCIAQAVILDKVTGSADCNAWQADVTIWFREGANNATLVQTVVLTDADGQEVQRFEETGDVPLRPGELVTFTYTGAWAETPGDGWQVAGDFRLLDNYTDGYNETVGTFTTAVACVSETGDGEAPPPSGCVQPPGWWRKHRDAWPTDQLELGDRMLEAGQIMHILKRPAWGNPAMLLARHVIAAKFNVLIDPDAGLDEALDAADAFLTEHPPLPGMDGNRRNWRRARVDRRAVRSLAMPILWYNWSGCRGEDPAAASGPVAVDLDLLDKAFDEAESPGDQVSFGAIKSMYR